MAGSCDGLTFTNAADCSTQLPGLAGAQSRNHSFQPPAVPIETPAKLSASGPESGSSSGCLHCPGLWKRNILWRLSDGLRIRKNGS